MTNRTGAFPTKLSQYAQRFITGWHFMRWLRLGLGIFLGWQFASRPDAITGLVAAFFLFQAITDTGCCGSAGCAIPVQDKQKADGESIVYEEIEDQEKTVVIEKHEKT